MKVCFITHNLNTTDGGGRFSHDLVENLKKEGIEITVITTKNSKPLLNFFKIRKIFKNSDIIHAIDIWPNGFYARLVSLGLKKPIIITALGTYSVAPFFSWRRFLMKWTCSGVQLVAISEYTKEKILEIIPNLDIKVIFPGFDLGFWGDIEVRISRSGLASAGRTSNFEVGFQYKSYILSVGALKFRKGYHNSIKAFAAVAKKIGNLNYVIVGQGEKLKYARKLKKIIKENGLEKRVFFISSGIDDKRLLGFYRNAELFVLTPVEENHHFEGFGIVYLEAAASGLPVVATYKSGATSAVSEDYNGLLVSQNDSNSTADAILKILENPELKTKFSNNSRELVKDFDEEKITDKYIQIYSSYVEHH